MENVDIVIDGSIATWTMAAVDGDLGGTYKGTFQFRTFLNPIQQLQAGREFRELLGNNPAFASDTESNLAFAISQLKQRIIKSPPFWSSAAQDGGVAGNIGDLNVIALVLDAAIRAEHAFKERITKEREAVLERAIQVGEALAQKDKEA